MIKQKISSPVLHYCFIMRCVSTAYIVLSIILVLVVLLWYNDTMSCLSLFDTLASTSQYFINNSTICQHGKKQKIVFLKTHKVRYSNSMLSYLGTRMTWCPSNQTFWLFLNTISPEKGGPISNKLL